MKNVVASQVSVRDLKTHLSAWLARAQAGEVVEVTSHRKPIARLTAIRQPDSTSTNPFQNAIDAGLVTWSGKKPVLPPPVMLNDGGPLISDRMVEACDGIDGIVICRISRVRRLPIPASAPR